MRRADILSLVDFTVGQFDALIARGLAPISASRREKGWGTFSADDALRVGLFAALNRAGVSQAQSAAIVRSQYELLLERLERDAPSDVWFGIFKSVARAQGEPSAALALPLIATIAEFADEMRRIQTVTGDGDPVESLVVINATSVMRSMLKRADELGIADDRLSELARKVGAVR
jgi:hypothetical protein